MKQNMLWLIAIVFCITILPVVGQEAPFTLVKVEGIGAPEYPFSIEQETNAAFLQAVLPKSKMHFVSRKNIAYPVTYIYDKNKLVTRKERFYVESRKASLLINTLNQAYSAHAFISISPELLWYTMVHEVAICIKKNPKAYAHLFTDSPGKKKTIHVQDDSLVYGSPQNNWAGTLDLFAAALRKNVAAEHMNVFLPKFSTMTRESEMAILVNFMDVVSEYYEFRLSSACGIPQIRLEGSVADWQLLLASTETLQTMFKQDLDGYFIALFPILREILATVKNERTNPVFWRSIYKWNSSSSGPSRISGWICAFQAYRKLPGEGKAKYELKSPFDTKDEQRAREATQFPSHVTTVEFKWDAHGTEYKMAFFAGILGVDILRVRGNWHLDIPETLYLKPALGYGVVELLPVNPDIEEGEDPK